MEKIRGHNESGGDDNSNKYGAESHAPNLGRMRRTVKWGVYAFNGKDGWRLRPHRRIRSCTDLAP
jgi:hypothetical protein